MKDHGLDLAVIGNGRTAALVDPCAGSSGGAIRASTAIRSSAGWWPARGEGILRRRARRHGRVSIRICAQYGDRLHAPDRSPGRQGKDHRFRPALPPLWPRLSPAADFSHRRAAAGLAAHHHPDAADQRTTANRCRNDRSAAITSAISAKVTDIRLTTDAPLSFIERRAPFVLTRPLHLVFGSGRAVPRRSANDLPGIRRSHARLLDSNGCGAFDLLRLAGSRHPRRDHAEALQFRGNRRIVAALTTSIPEAPRLRPHLGLSLLLAARCLFRRAGAQPHRRDAHHGGVHLLHACRSPADRRANCSRLYGVGADDRARQNGPRHDLQGYRGDGPVRIGNAAVDQVQHDTYGSVILAAMPMFFDRRLPRPAMKALFRLLETLGATRGRNRARAGCRHLGISRTPARPHPFGRDVLGRLSAARGHRQRIGLADRAKYWNAHCRAESSALARTRLEREARRLHRRPSIDDLDASVLFLPDLGVVEADDPRFVSTVAAMERELVREKHVMRYASADDFGLPDTAFLDLPLLADRRAVVARAA